MTTCPKSGATDNEVQSKPQPRSQSFRFGLRLLLLVICLCATIFAWIGAVLQLRRIERTAAVENTCRWVTLPLKDTYARIDGDGFVREARFFGRGIPTSVKFDRTHQVCLGDMPEEEFAKLAGFPALTTIILSRKNSLSRKGAGHLAHCRGLTYLAIHQCDVSEEAIEQLATIGRLDHLLFEDTNVTQRQVDRLQKMLPNCSIELRRSSFY